MTIRRLLFVLFLYLLLVWLMVGLRHSGDTKALIDAGLRWSAVGVGILLACVIFEKVFEIWRDRKSLPKPQNVPVSANAGSQEDDRAFASLIREADQRMTTAAGPSATRQNHGNNLPVFLVVGPERVGKTAIIQNCAPEALLLAGQAVAADGGAIPTRVSNIWLADGSVFLEIGGRIFNSDSLRFANMLRVLQSRGATSGWRSWLRLVRRPLNFKGVVLCQDLRAFSGSPEPSVLDSLALQTREKLMAIAQAMGDSVPIYVLFTHADTIPFFEEYFGRFGDEEFNRVLGVVTTNNGGETDGVQVWAEAESKRLGRLFQSIFLRLSRRRLVALAAETDARRKPAIYQFPREFKKLRTPVIQFLVDVFKPHPLEAGPSLRGFFFVGVRKRERPHSISTDDASVFLSARKVADATQYFDTAKDSSVENPLSFGAPLAGQRQWIEQWAFTTEFFTRILRQDRDVLSGISPPRQIERYRRVAFGAATAMAALSIVWLFSGVGNLALTNEVSASIQENRNTAKLTMASLSALDQLREKVIRLEKDEFWKLHWGLYTGDSLHEIARRAYFDRLRQLALDDLNRTIITRLRNANAESGRGGSENTYDLLKTHITITALGCPVDSPLLVKTLNHTVTEAFPGIGPEERELLSKQLQFYSSRLDKRLTEHISLTEDRVAEERARTLLRDPKRLDDRLRMIFAEIQPKVKPLVVADFAEGYGAVLSGPAEMEGVFTKPGQAVFEERIAKENLGGGESCVTGRAQIAQLLDSETRDRMRALYYRQYADAWHEFLRSFKVVRYSNVQDAAKKLGTLALPQSPLLGILSMVAKQTNFAPQKVVESAAAGKVKNLVPKLDAAVAAAGRVEARIARAIESASMSPAMTPAEVARLFQPAQFATPPDSATLVSDQNRGYIEGLRALALNLENYARASSTERPAVLAPARSAADQALAAHQKLADYFSGDTEGVNKIVGDLLAEPIRFAVDQIPRNLETLSSGKRSGELAQLCRDLKPILSKYPFDRASQVDAELVDLDKAFQPGVGLIWKYANGAGAELLVKNPDWRQKPDLTGVRVSPDLLNFLNRAQQLTDLLYVYGTTITPTKYELWPVEVQGAVVRLVIDGTELNRAKSKLRSTFYWPAPAGAKRGAEGNLIYTGEVGTGFGRFDGLWGVFRLFQFADERAGGALDVQWSQNRGLGSARPQPLTPPAKVQFAEFPDGVDLFNPKFFEALRCPQGPVLPN